MVVKRIEFTRIVSTGAEPPMLPFMVDHLDGEPMYFVSEEEALNLWRESAGHERERMRDYFDNIRGREMGLCRSVVDGLYSNIVTHDDFILARQVAVQSDVKFHKQWD